MSLKAFNHGKGQIDLQHLGPSALELRPSEIHLKENGSTSNEPSFAIVLEGGPLKVYGQVSLKMLNEALGELGYTIIQP